MSNKVNSERYPDFSLFDQDLEGEGIPPQEGAEDEDLTDLNLEMDLSADLHGVPAYYETSANDFAEALAADDFVDDFANPEMIMAKIVEEKSLLEQSLLNVSYIETPSAQAKFMRETVIPAKARIETFLTQLDIAREIFANHEPIVRGVFESLHDPE